MKRASHIAKHSHMIAKQAAPIATTAPSEFRVFERGWNHYEGLGDDGGVGNFLFDDIAAKAVMASFKAHGVDMMIDLEHLSLNQSEPNYDPDARGYCKLALRSGELWAVNVKWNPDGTNRLKSKTQRYISPVFNTDKKTHRIMSVHNIAICGIPATRNMPALVAAKKRAAKKPVATEVNDMEELKKVAAKLGLAEDASLEDILAAIGVLMEDEGSEDGDTATASDESGDDEDTETASDDGDDEEEDGKTASKLSKLLPPKAAARIVAALHRGKVAEARITALETKTAKKEVEDLIRDNTDKIPLTLEKWARKQTPDALREFLKDMPKATRVAAKKVPGQGGDGEAESVELNDAERKVCKMNGTSPVKMLEFKKARAAKKAAQAS